MSMGSELFIRFIADILVVPIVLIGTFALLRYVPKKGRFAAYTRIVMAGLTALLLAKLAAATWQPETARPFIEYGVAPGAAYLDNPGFPSDHMLLTMSIALAVYAETGKHRLGLILVALALLVGVGRVLALVHTPVDVVGGVVFALLGGLWYLTRSRRS